MREKNIAVNPKKIKKVSEERRFTDGEKHS